MQARPAVDTKDVIVEGAPGLAGLSEPDSPADDDDVNAPGQFLVDLEDLPDLAADRLHFLRLNPCSSSATTVAASG